MTLFAALCLVTSPLSLLQPQGLVGACGIAALLPVAVLAARDARRWTRAISRRPWLVVVVGASLGALASAAGAHNEQFFVLCSVGVGTVAVPTDPRWALVGATAAAIGMALPVIDNPAQVLGTALAVVIAPVLLLMLVTTLIRYVLALPTGPYPGNPEPRAQAVGDTPAPRRGVAALVRGRRYVESASVSLTSRQYEVLQLLHEGLTQAEIAGSLGLTADQVGRHLRRARERTGAQSNPQLVALAIDAGLLVQPQRHPGVRGA